MAKTAGTQIADAAPVEMFNRRKVLRMNTAVAATAFVGAMPVVSSLAIAAGDPDVRLRRLYEEWREADAEALACYERQRDIYKTAEKAFPEVPNSIRFRTGGQIRALSLGEIETLGEQEWTASPNEATKLRSQKRRADFDAYRKECDAILSRMGYWAVEATMMAADERANDRLDEILATPAASAAGILIKLQVWADSGPKEDEQSYAESCVTSALEDARRLAS